MFKSISLAIWQIFVSVRMLICFRILRARFYGSRHPTCPHFLESAIWKKARFQHIVAIRIQICCSFLRDEYAGYGADQACASCDLLSIPGPVTNGCPVSKRRPH